MLRQRRLLVGFFGIASGQFEDDASDIGNVSKLHLSDKFDR